MKIPRASFWVLLTMSMAAVASSGVARAGSTSLSSRADAFGTCDSITFSSCALLLQQQAERSAGYDLDRQCSQLQGSVVGRYCRSQCNPIAPPPPPNPTPIYTTCTADCSATCSVN